MSEYHVYVIGLKKTVLENRKFKRANPDYIEGKPCVYIGQSWHPPQKRFAQHKEGHNSNDFAKDYGEYLQTRLFENLNPLHSREEAEEMEEKLALRLRKRGYVVWWG